MYLCFVGRYRNIFQAKMAHPWKKLTRTPNNILTCVQTNVKVQRVDNFVQSGHLQLVRHFAWQSQQRRKLYTVMHLVDAREILQRQSFRDKNQFNQCRYCKQIEIILLLNTPWAIKKRATYFYDNFGKCGPISIILSLLDSQINCGIW